MVNEAIKYTALGRRKEAVARVKLAPGSGKIFINDRSFDEYFSKDTHRLIITQPLKMTNTLNTYDIYANVRGGGVSGQAGAVQHGISRALLQADPGLKVLLRKLDFLTRDPRMKERKKYGRKGARKRFQWTKR